MYTRFHHCLEQHRHKESKRIRNHDYQVPAHRLRFFFAFSFRLFFLRRKKNVKKTANFVGENSSS